MCWTSGPRALPPRPSGYRLRWRPVREALDHSPAFLLWKSLRRFRNDLACDSG